MFDWKNKYVTRRGPRGSGCGCTGSGSCGSGCSKARGSGIGSTMPVLNRLDVPKGSPMLPEADTDAIAFPIRMVPEAAQAQLLNGMKQTQVMPFDYVPEGEYFPPAPTGQNYETRETAQVDEGEAYFDYADGVLQDVRKFAVEYPPVPPSEVYVTNAIFIYTWARKASEALAYAIQVKPSLASDQRNARILDNLEVSLRVAKAYEEGAANHHQREIQKATRAARDPIQAYLASVKDVFKQAAEKARKVLEDAAPLGVGAAIVGVLALAAYALSKR